jgi:hypothetical protein
MHAPDKREPPLEELVSIEPLSEDTALIHRLLAPSPAPDPQQDAAERLVALGEQVPLFFEGRLDRLFRAYELSVDYYDGQGDRESANMYVSEYNYLAALVARMQNEYAFAMFRTGEKALMNKFLIVGYEPGARQTDTHVFGIAAAPREYAQIFNGETKFGSYVLVVHSYRGKGGELRSRGLIANPPKYARALLEQKDENVPVVFPSIEQLAIDAQGA